MAFCIVFCRLFFLECWGGVYRRSPSGLPGPVGLGGERGEGGGLAEGAVVEVVEAEVLEGLGGAVAAVCGRGEGVVAVDEEAAAVGQRGPAALPQILAQLLVGLCTGV